MQFCQAEIRVQIKGAISSLCVPLISELREWKKECSAFVEWKTGLGYYLEEAERDQKSRKL